MRLWSLDPALLDRQGLVACWREALLAQAVLLGKTAGYTRHPQLERFREHEHPLAAIAEYLAGLHQESLQRGYRFDAGRIAGAGEPQVQVDRIRVTTGQLEYEWEHLRAKLTARSPQSLGHFPPKDAVPAHPLFRSVPGPIHSWERTSAA